MPVITPETARQVGYPSGKYFIQTILIDKSLSKPQAINWLKEHGYAHKYYRTTQQYHRFMQHNPVEGAKYYTEKISPYVELVYQKYY